MKTVRFASPLFNALLALISFFVLGSNAVAQEKLYYNHPGRGHWKLFTDPVNRNTTIRFFDKNNQLIYEEVLSDRYVKLTDRNVALLSRTLEQVTKNTLVLERVKSTALPVDRSKGAFGKKANTTVGAAITEMPKDDNGTFGIHINFIPAENTAKFKVLLENPARRRIDVQLEDEKNRLYYVETINSPGYKRSFDLQSLPRGTYTLRVMTLDRKYKFSKQITLGPSVQNRQIEQPAPALITSTPSH